MHNCYIHRDQEAQIRCERCNEWICEACIKHYNQYNCEHEVCPKCYKVFMGILDEFEDLDLF